MASAPMITVSLSLFGNLFPKRGAYRVDKKRRGPLDTLLQPVIFSPISLITIRGPLKTVSPISRLSHVLPLTGFFNDGSGLYVPICWPGIQALNLRYLVFSKSFCQRLRRKLPG